MFDERERLNRWLAGRVCADQIVPYPPGIPVLVPGQVITRDDRGYVGDLLRSQKRWRCTASCTRDTSLHPRAEA